MTGLEELDEAPSTLMNAGASGVATIVDQLKQLPFVVTLHGTSLKFRNTVQHSNGVWATPNQITHEDDPITRSDCRSVEQLIEFIKTSVNVSYDECSTHGATTIAQRSAFARLRAPVPGSRTIN